MNKIDVIYLINRVLNLTLDPENTPSDQSLKSLGIDSLDVFNILVELESVTGHKVPDEEVEDLNTIDALINFFVKLK